MRWTVGFDLGFAAAVLRLAAGFAGSAAFGAATGFSSDEAGEKIPRLGSLSEGVRLNPLEASVAVEGFSSGLGSAACATAAVAGVSFFFAGLAGGFAASCVAAASGIARAGPI